MSTAGSSTSSARRGVGPRRAFSLFEAVLAIALIVGLAGGVFTFLFNLGRQRESLDRQTLGLRGGAALFDGLEADLGGVVAGDPREGSGVVGDETSLTLLTRGVAPPRPGAGSATLVGDLQGVEYRFEASGGTLTARRWSVLGSDRGGAGEAVGGREPWGDAGGAPEETAVLADGVERVRMRYFDGSSWRASFNSSAQGALPVAIEIAVWFGEGGGEDPSFSASREPGLAEGDVGVVDEGALAEAPLPPPDRVRTIVIPDGPVASWRAGG